MANKLVQLRLPRDEVTALKNAAELGRRTMQEEIRHRLTGYHAGQSGVAAGPERALGDLASFIAARARDALWSKLGPDGWNPPAGLNVEEAYRAVLLPTVRDALAKVFNDLGAEGHKPPSGDIVAAITFDIKRRVTAPRAEDTTADGQILAAIGKAWAPQSAAETFKGFVTAKEPKPSKKGKA